MEPASINTFLDQFLAVADTGFGLVRGDVGFVLNALIVVSIALAGAQWALSDQAPAAPLFRKVLFVGFFAFLINNWPFLSMAIAQSGAMLGLKAGGGGLSLEDLHNPGRIAAIGVELFGRTVALAEGMDIFTDAIAMATIFIAAIFVMLGFFVLALQVFVALIGFKLGSLAAFIALPWGVFNGTSWVAERPLGWVAGFAIRLFLLALVTSVSMNFVEALPATFSLEDGGALNVLLFGATTFALAWFAPLLAGEVMDGRPSLSAAEPTGGAIAGAYIGAAAARGASGVVRSLSPGPRPATGQSAARGSSVNYRALTPNPSGLKTGGRP